MTIDRYGLASDAFTITPGDGTAIRAEALYVGGSGNVTVVTEEGNTVTFTGVQGGSILPIGVVRVNATNTTATSIVGFR